MLEKIGPVSNPLTIIAIFAGIAEVSGTLILPFLSVSIQGTYIWFLMGFPTILLLLFFFVLYKKHMVLYAPSDYRSDDAFESLAKTTQQVKEQVEKVDERITKVNERVSEVDERTKNDTRTLNLVQSILNPRDGDQPISQEELEEGIKGASEGMKDYIFSLANNVRFENWRLNKSIMERTIPIFRALVTSDSENKYDYYHGTLGFDLKDKQNVEKSDWEEACKELTKAIRIRGEWKPEYGFFSLYYEINRAVCKINLDKEYKNNKPSTLEVKTDILKDLSYSYPHLPDFEDDSISKWTKLNNLDSNDLLPS